MERGFSSSLGTSQGSFSLTQVSDFYGSPLFATTTPSPVTRHLSQAIASAKAGLFGLLFVLQKRQVRGGGWGRGYGNVAHTVR